MRCLNLIICIQKDDAGSSDEDDTVPFFSHLSSTATVTASEEERAASTVLPAVHQPTSAQEAAPSGDLTGYTLNDSHRSHGYVSLNEPAPSLWYTSSQAYTSYLDPASEYAPQHYQYSYQQRDQNAPGCSQQGDTPVHVDGGVSAGHEPELDNESVSPIIIQCSVLMIEGAMLNSPLEIYVIHGNHFLVLLLS